MQRFARLFKTPQNPALSSPFHTPHCKTRALSVISLQKPYKIKWFDIPSEKWYNAHRSGDIRTKKMGLYDELQNPK
ncbi:hypothetical protein KAR91_22385 [Candidatus Pacearchaeota archaeon]|nr:hypothetical protein [Candidatus Pacearchaeota archaeon]